GQKEALDNLSEIFAMKIDKARLPELEIIYLELKMKVSRSAAIESPRVKLIKKNASKLWS
ncbi:hypothetical protein HID58_048343, partial [Brassica napus]